ncbi:MAG: hypothetical protein NTX87_04585 [Planctomycetota bacterium]|nr:hypothetical protein [Planctomycetota bacterium]
MRKASRPRGVWVLFAAMALAAGCEAPVPPEARTRDVVRPHLGFAVNVPEGWNFRDLDGDVALEIYPQPPASAGGEAGSEKVSGTLRLKVPDTFSDPAAPAAGLAASPPAPPHARPLLAAVHVAVIDRAGIGLAEWADQAVGESRELQPDLEVVKREPGRLADGRDALVLVLRNPRGLSPTVQRMLLAMTGRRAYAVLATAPEPEGPTVEAAFKKCFDSFIVW